MRRMRLLAMATTIALTGLVVASELALAEPTWSDDVLVSDGLDGWACRQRRPGS